MVRKHIFIILVILLAPLAVLLVTSSHSIGEIGELALVTVRRVTSQMLRDRYTSNEEPLTILIVPGHDNQFPGAVYGNLRETDINIELAGYIFDSLKKDPNFKPVLTRDIGQGDYLSGLKEFFVRERMNAYLAQVDLSKIAEGWLEREGPPPAAQSTKPTSENIFRLYAINKWAEENDFDITLHIHFNDQYRKNLSRPGNFVGYSIFIPGREDSHHQVSKELAQAVYKSIGQSFRPSTAPGEARGIIESSELIALGGINKSRYGAVFLVEYGYIYENIVTNKDLRRLVLPEMARRTHSGLRNFFEEDLSDEEVLQFSPFTYSWNENLIGNERSNPQVFLLKHFLTYEQNLYPPHGQSARECPLDGNYDYCLRQAVKTLQERYRQDILSPLGLYHGTGIAGPATMNFLRNFK